MVAVINPLQLLSQVPCIVLVQRIDQIHHPALSALQVLVKFVCSRTDPPHILPGVKLIPVGIGEAAQGIDQRRHVDVTEPAHVPQDVVIHFVLGETHPGSAPAGTRTEGEQS